MLFCFSFFVVVVLVLLVDCLFGVVVIVDLKLFSSVSFFSRGFIFSSERESEDMTLTVPDLRMSTAKRKGC